MNRRTLLVGIGTLTLGSGAVIGSGAFSTVEAQRTVTVQTAGDGAALLQIDDATGGTYVTTNDGVVEIDIGSGSAGVNRSARTVFDPLLEISNNGTQDVTSISFVIDGNNGEDQLLTPIPEAGYGDGDGDFPGSNTSALTPTDDPVTLGLEIELRESELTDPGNIAAYDNGDIVQSNFDPTLVIAADTA